MKTNLLQTFLEKIDSRFFFVLLFLYQLFFIFQGLDFSDEGFYGAFYQQIFSAPQSVAYNFMYWLSGIIGGAYLSLFPQYGLLALRLGGVIMVTSTIILVYHFLKRYINTAHLKLGLLIATVAISFDPKDLNYDNLSSLFFVSAAWFLFFGIRNNQPAKLFVSGIFISLNTFTRIPNILGLGLISVIVFHEYFGDRKWNRMLMQSLLLVSGFAVTSFVILMVMKLIGQLPIFIDCINLVKQMGQSKENSHGVLRMINLFWHQYGAALVYGILFLVLVFIAGKLVNIDKSRRTLNNIATLSGYFIILLLLAFAFKGYITWFLLLSTVTGLALIAGFMIITKSDNMDNRILALIGMAMVIIQPLGSDYGLYSMGRYSLWLALPIAVNYYFSLGTASVVPGRDNQTSGTNPNSRITFPDRAKLIGQWTAGGLIILFLFFALTYSWYDSRDRTKMLYQVDNKFLKGVYTTKVKATLLNELLQESAKYVKKDDYVLAYDLIPLFHPMTETRPFMRNSWPKLYDRAVFKSELEKAMAERKILPVVIFQKVNSYGKPNWPDPKDDNSDWDINQPRNATIKEFLENNHYHIVWENIAFRIYIPG